MKYLLKYTDRAGSVYLETFNTYESARKFILCDIVYTVVGLYEIGRKVE